MKRLQIVAVGKISLDEIQPLAKKLGKHFALPCDILPETIDPQFAFHAERGQYHSSEILAEVHRRANENSWRILGITDVDLYIPILTFVFGEAKMGGPATIISTHRLRQTFYGLEADPELLRTRLLKEAVHELGHTLELTHCEDYQCAMASSHSVEWIDLKEDTFCGSCANYVSTAVTLANR